MSNSAPAKHQLPNEAGLGLGFSLIGILIVLFIAVLSTMNPGPMKAGVGTVLLGIYLMVWGIIFIASYYYSHKTFFFRGLIWFCEKFSFPRRREMALFCGVLGVGMGGAAVILGVSPE
jgi:uncharacterized membrane protein